MAEKDFGDYFISDTDEDLVEEDEDIVPPVVLPAPSAPAPSRGVDRRASASAALLPRRCRDARCPPAVPPVVAAPEAEEPEPAEAVPAAPAAVEPPLWTRLKRLRPLSCLRRPRRQARSRPHLHPPPHCTGRRAGAHGRASPRPGRTGEPRGATRPRAQRPDDRERRHPGCGARLARRVHDGLGASRGHARGPGGRHVRGDPRSRRACSRRTRARGALPGIHRGGRRLRRSHRRRQAAPC